MTKFESGSLTGIVELDINLKIMREVSFEKASRISILVFPAHFHLSQIFDLLFHQSNSTPHSGRHHWCTYRCFEWFQMHRTMSECLTLPPFEDLLAEVNDTVNSRCLHSRVTNHCFFEIVKVVMPHWAFNTTTSRFVSSHSRTFSRAVELNMCFESTIRVQPKILPAGSTKRYSTIPSSNEPNNFIKTFERNS